MTEHAFEHVASAEHRSADVLHELDYLAEVAEVVEPIVTELAERYCQLWEPVGADGVEDAGPPDRQAPEVADNDRVRALLGAIAARSSTALGASVESPAHRHVDRLRRCDLQRRREELREQRRASVEAAERAWKAAARADAARRRANDRRETGATAGIAVPNSPIAGRAGDAALPPVL